MELISKGIPDPVWIGTCKKCRAKFRETDANIRRGHVDRCQREYYEFAQRDCPECKALAPAAVTLYPTKASQQH